MVLIEAEFVQGVEAVAEDTNQVTVAQLEEAPTITTTLEQTIKDTTQMQTMVQ